MGIDINFWDNNLKDFVIITVYEETKWHKQQDLKRAYGSCSDGYGGQGIISGSNNNGKFGNGGMS